MAAAAAATAVVRAYSIFKASTQSQWRGSGCSWEASGAAACAAQVLGAALPLDGRLRQVLDGSDEVAGTLDLRPIFRCFLDAADEQALPHFCTHRHTSHARH